MKNRDVAGNEVDLRVVAAVIDALKTEVGSALDTGTKDLFDRLSSELRSRAGNGARKNGVHG